MGKTQIITCHELHHRELKLIPSPPHNALECKMNPKNSLGSNLLSSMKKFSNIFYFLSCILNINYLLLIIANWLLLIIANWLCLKVCFINNVIGTKYTLILFVILKVSHK